MKAALSAEHACRWLVDATKHSLTDLQEPLLQIVTREWDKICEECPESTEPLMEFPRLLHAITVL